MLFRFVFCIVSDGVGGSWIFCNGVVVILGTLPDLFSTPIANTILLFVKLHFEVQSFRIVACFGELAVCS